MNKLKSKLCPQCGEPFEHGAISRVDNMTEICSDCGMFEAVSDFKQHMLQKEPTLRECIESKIGKATVDEILNAIHPAMEKLVWIAKRDRNLDLTRFSTNYQASLICEQILANRFEQKKRSTSQCERTPNTLVHVITITSKNQ